MPLGDDRTVRYIYTVRIVSIIIVIIIVIIYYFNYFRIIDYCSVVGDCFLGNVWATEKSNKPYACI